MFEQSRRLSEPLQWGRREKTVVGVLLGCLLAGLLALGGYALSAGGAPQRDCVSVTFASTLGGAMVHACGAHARAMCAAGGGFHGIAAQELRVACARAGYPYAGS